MRRAKRITALAVAAAMVFSNVAYAAPGTDTTTTQAGAESAESLNSQSDASGGIEGQASDQTGNGTDSSAQSKEQTETKKTDTSETTTDAGGQNQTPTTEEETTKAKNSESSETKSADTQTQTTLSNGAEDQKSDDKKDTSNTEKEPVLYDITFETPEKHGKVTDMDGKEVTDGKTLKTDENGKIQFKVKADDGYQVHAVYQMPDEQTPLKLVKDSYYELQVDKNTTVKVVYQKIPEKNDDSEDADSKAEEPKKDEVKEEAETEKNDQQSEETQTSDSSKKEETNGKVSMKAMLAANPDQEATVTINGAGENNQQASIKVGTIEENAPAFQGYEFVNAKVGNTLVETLAYDSNSNSYYVATSDNQLTGIKLQNTTDLVLYYREEVKTFNVDYKVFVDSKEVDKDSALKLVGVAQVEEGDDLEFSFELKKGYTLENYRSVTVNNQLISIKDGKYTVENITEDQTVVIQLNKIKSYNFTFANSSNTILTYNNEDYKSVSNGSVPLGSYAAGSQTLVFILAGRGDQNQMKGGALNKLVLTIDGVQYSVDTPANPDNYSTVTTTLANGYTVSLKWIGEVSLDNRVQGSSGTAPKYEVTIKANSEEGLHGDISVSTNYKTKTSSEVWVKQADGVENNTVHIGKLSNTGWPFYKDEWELEGYSPDIFKFFTRTSTEQTYVFFNIAPGYSTDSKDISIRVYYDGVPNDVKALDANSKNSEYDFYFVIPEDSRGFSPKDIRINISVKALEKTYVTKFTYGNGQDSTTVGSYKDGDSLLVTDGKDEYPTKEDYVFMGWQLGNTIYKPNSFFSIDEKTEKLATFDRDIGKYIFNFEAVWEKADQSEKALYKINFFFEKDNGYVNMPDVSISEYGPKGETAFIIQDQLNDVLEGKQGLPENWKTDYELDHAKNGNYSVEVKADGSSVISIYYARKSYNLTIKYVDQKGKDLKSSFVTSHKVGKTISAKPEEISGYKVISGAVTPNTAGDVNKKDFGFTGTMQKDGVTVTYTYAKKQGLVRYNLTGGTWEVGEGWTTQEGSSGQLIYVSPGYYEYPDSFIVTDNVPTREGYVFVGWLDKERTSDNVLNVPAAIRKAGETVQYIYDEDSDDNVYTLDAIWAQINVENKTQTYNGQGVQLDQPSLKYSTSEYDNLLNALGIKLENVTYQLVEKNGQNVGDSAQENVASQTDVGVYVYNSNFALE